MTPSSPSHQDDPPGAAAKAVAVRDAAARARTDFLTMVETIRPALHRYCARLMGSVIDGEDIVQETLARGFYALAMAAEPPELKPWLFRIAHHAALDDLKRHGRTRTTLRDDLDDDAGHGGRAGPSGEALEEWNGDIEPDPLASRLALSRFLALPTSQRSAVILKDVLGHSLQETSEIMETTVMAVKAALVRGRATLRLAQDNEDRLSAADSNDLERYVERFNARDWDGVRALIGEDCRLDLVSKSQRHGKQVGLYFTRYAAEEVKLVIGDLDGQTVLAAFVGEEKSPSHFIVLEFDDAKVSFIRDFRYVEYIATDAQFTARGGERGAAEWTLHPDATS